MNADVDQRGASGTPRLRGPLVLLVLVVAIGALGAVIWFGVR